MTDSPIAGFDGLSNGTVVYHPEIEARPATSETTGNVTINNAAVDGVERHFSVTFFISAPFQKGGLSSPNNFYLDVAVPADSRAAPYEEVEDAAARSLPAYLRSLADQIEADVADMAAMRAEATK